MAGRHTTLSSKYAVYNVFRGRPYADTNGSSLQLEKWPMAETKLLLIHPALFLKSQ